MVKLHLKPNPARPSDVTFQQDLQIAWRDGKQTHYPFRMLRNACACAHCVDELSGKKVLKEETIAANIALTKAEYVGVYALRLSFSDGHSSGIFPFRRLRSLYDEAEKQGFPQGGPHPGEK